MTRSLMPADTPEYMFDAWASAINWAVGEGEILARFRADTGNTWEPGQAPVEKMVDDAAGAGKQFCEAFIAWFNVNVWGPMDGPGEEA